MITMKITMPGRLASTSRSKWTAHHCVDEKKINIATSRDAGRRYVALSRQEEPAGYAERRKLGESIEMKGLKRR